MEPFNPEAKTYPVLKQSFNKEISRYVKNTENSGADLNVIMLMCPAYPHNGTRYVYDGGMMSGSLTPVTPIFQRESDKLLSILHQRGFPQQKINLLPTICEIEEDLPNVVSTFAGGDENFFLECIQSTAEKTGKFFSRRYLGFNITPGTFTQLMPTLTDDRRIVGQQLDFMCGNGTIPEVLVRQMEFVAVNRNDMFTKLYGAIRYDEFIVLARRQMQNYLAVMRGLAFSFPEGSIVLNLNTPNSAYVKQPENMLRNVIQVGHNKQLPNFYFF